MLVKSPRLPMAVCRQDNASTTVVTVKPYCTGWDTRVAQPGWYLRLCLISSHSQPAASCRCQQYLSQFFYFPRLLTVLHRIDAHEVFNRLNCVSYYLSAQKGGAGTPKSPNSSHGVTCRYCQTQFIHRSSPWIKSMPINAVLLQWRENTFSPKG